MMINNNDDLLVISSVKLGSRLFLGTGKFSGGEVLRRSLKVSAPGFITCALRRVDLNNPEDPILSAIDMNKYRVVPNTSGAANAEEAVRIAHLCRQAGGYTWIKLEIHPDNYHLMPDAVETLKAAQQLVRDGFTVLPYIHADPVLAKQLEEIGCAAVMPLAAPIGTNLGLQAEEFIRIIIERATVPVIIDAGIGKPSQAAACMELGAAGVLVNTAIATAVDPAAMAQAFAEAVRAGRRGFLAGLPTSGSSVVPSSPLTGFLD